MTWWSPRWHQGCGSYLGQPLPPDGGRLSWSEESAAAIWSPLNCAAAIVVAHLARACAGDIFIRALRTNPGMCLPCFFAASCALNVIVIVVRHAQHGQLSTVLRELSTPCERATTFRAREEWNTFYSSQGAERLRSGSPIQCMPYITTTVLRNVPTAHCHANTMRNAGPHRVE